jgi:hypothetical protein
MKPTARTMSSYFDITYDVAATAASHAMLNLDPSDCVMALGYLELSR